MLQNNNRIGYSGNRFSQNRTPSINTLNLDVTPPPPAPEPPVRSRGNDRRPAAGATEHLAAVQKERDDLNTKLFSRTDLYLKQACREYFKLLNNGNTNFPEPKEHDVGVVQWVAKNLGVQGAQWFTDEFVQKLNQAAENLKKGHGTTGWRPGGGLNHRGQPQGREFLAALDNVKYILQENGFSSYNQAIHRSNDIDRRLEDARIAAGGGGRGRGA